MTPKLPDPATRIYMVRVSRNDRGFKYPVNDASPTVLIEPIPVFHRDSANARRAAMDLCEEVRSWFFELHGWDTYITTEAISPDDSRHFVCLDGYEPRYAPFTVDVTEETVKP